MNLRIAKKLMPADYRATSPPRFDRWRLAGRKLAKAAGRRTRLLSPGIQERSAIDHQVDYGSGPQEARTLGEWAIWFECLPLRRVAHTVTARKTVSTIFMGIGGFDPVEPDLYESAWWETAHGPFSRTIEILARYPTRAAALEGHARLVKLARGDIQ